MKDPEDIRAWQRLSSEITTSGRLQEGDPARLAEIGTRRDVHLALADHPEALRDEARLLDEHGIDYLHIPVPFDAPTVGHFEAFKASLEDVEVPVHVHCIMNWRVSAFFYLLNLEQGLPERKARQIMACQWNPIEAEEPYARPWAQLIAKLKASFPGQ